MAGKISLYNYYHYLFVQLEYRHKCLLRHLDRSELSHALFALFLLFKQLFLSGYIAAVAFGKDVFSERLDRFARDYLARNRHLYRHFKKLARNVILQLFGNSAGFVVGIVGMMIILAKKRV